MSFRARRSQTELLVMKKQDLEVGKSSPCAAIAGCSTGKCFDIPWLDPFSSFSKSLKDTPPEEDSDQVTYLPCEHTTKPSIHFPILKALRQSEFTAKM